MTSLFGLLKYHSLWLKIGHQTSAFRSQFFCVCRGLTESGSATRIPSTQKTSYPVPSPQLHTYPSLNHRRYYAQDRRTSATNHPCTPDCTTIPDQCRVCETTLHRHRTNRFCDFATPHNVGCYLGNGWNSCRGFGRWVTAGRRSLGRLCRCLYQRSNRYTEIQVLQSLGREEYNTKVHFSWIL